MKSGGIGSKRTLAEARLGEPPFDLALDVRRGHPERQRQSISASQRRGTMLT
jgi:hypothetical protein